jgi:putative PIG3 family NAD(P)H quinone oxidoreductase
MRAIQIENGELTWSTADDVVCGVGEVQIQVMASAVNRADLLQASGGYPPPPGASPIIGLECAGEVVAIGEGVQRVAVGDRVCALLAGGGYAEQVVVPAGQVLPIPKGLSFEQAAALPEVFATAYLNLYMEAQLGVQEKVLLHAGASGVGTAAIQMLKCSNNPCFVTAGSDEKIAQCKSLGAQGGFDRHQGSFLQAVQEWAGDSGVDVILDPVGAAYLADNLTVLGPRGRLVLIGLMGGIQTDMNLALLMMKRLRIIGSTLRARPIAEKAAVMDQLLKNVWPNIENGDIQPIIEAVLPLPQAQQAHQLVAGNDTVGKVVLSLA